MLLLWSILCRWAASCFQQNKTIHVVRRLPSQCLHQKTPECKSLVSFILRPLEKFTPCLILVVWCSSLNRNTGHQCCMGRALSMIKGWSTGQTETRLIMDSLFRKKNRKQEKKPFPQFWNLRLCKCISYKKQRWDRDSVFRDDFYLWLFWVRMCQWLNPSF